MTLIEPPAQLAHPLEDETAVMLYRSVEQTAVGLGSDRDVYMQLMRPLVAAADRLVRDLLAPPWAQRRPLVLLAGNAAHSFLPLDASLTAGFGVGLMILGHAVGWPIAAGGAGNVSAALVSELKSIGGVVQLDHPVRVQYGYPCRIERAAPRPRRRRVVDEAAAREESMREVKAGRSSAPWRGNPIIARIASAGAHFSGAVLLAIGVDGSFAARRNRNGDRKDDNGENSRDRADGKDRDRDRMRDEDRKADKENRDDRDRDRDRKNDDDKAADDESDVNIEQADQSDPDRDDDPGNNEETAGDGGGDGGGGRSNAGSGAFDNPLATKARRRSNDFDNRDRDDEEEDGVFADVDPGAESVYQTDSISFATGPEGIEILTKNITYIAAPTPTPTPIPRLEFPERDGYPFGEDFPFGVARVQKTPTATAPADPGDSTRDRSDPGDDAPARGDPEPLDPLPGETDGGDNSMDFTS